jgi:simple sugar transport system permease protein
MKIAIRVPIILTVLTMITLWMAFAAPGGDTTIQINNNANAAAGSSEAFRFANIITNTALNAWVSFGLTAAATAAAWSLGLTGRRISRWLSIIFGVLFVFNILVSLFNGQTMTITALLHGSLSLAVPLIFGSLAGVLSERVGLVNIAIEGQLLAGAFVSAMVATLAHNPWVGLIGAMAAGAVVSWLLAVFAIRYVVDQIIIGVVLNVLIVGLTNFMFSTFMSANSPAFNSPPRLPSFDIPGLAQIPVLGPVFFSQTPIVYLMYVAVAGVWFALYKTRWGLRLRAVGEYPKAADTVGIKVYATRYRSVMIGGALAGLGGAFFTIGQSLAFGKEMTNGAGYIALAALIFGRWNPIYAALAGLLFGFAENLQYSLSTVGSHVPSDFLLMVPYVLTVVLVAGLVGKVTGPAAAGKAYIKS